VLFGGSADRHSILADRRSHPEYVDRGWVTIADDEFNNRYVWAHKTGVVLFVDYSHGGGMAIEVAPSIAAFFDAIRLERDDE
jgi:hypothetical protein